MKINYPAALQNCQDPGIPFWGDHGKLPTARPAFMGKNHPGAVSAQLISFAPTAWFYPRGPKSLGGHELPPAHLRHNKHVPQPLRISRGPHATRHTRRVWWGPRWAATRLAILAFHGLCRTPAVCFGHIRVTSFTRPRTWAPPLPRVFPPRITSDIWIGWAKHPWSSIFPKRLVGKLPTERSKVALIV